MKNFLALYMLVFITATLQAQTSKEKSISLNNLLSSYYEESLVLSPITATLFGDNRYNDMFPIEFTDNYTAKYEEFYERYLSALSGIKRENLSENERLSYDIFKWDVKSKLEGRRYGMNLLLLFNQLTSIPMILGQAGSGKFVQPFKTETDYNNWIKRASAFSAWADSAIVYFRKGLSNGKVLPKALVEKMIPQMNSFITDDPTKSVFYGPVSSFPTSFSDLQKQELTNAYVKMISEKLVPTYKKLAGFLQTEYLPNSRLTSGLSGIPDGKAIYDYYVRMHTTTNVTAEELYNTGLAEVKRILSEMERIRQASGFEGDLKAFWRSFSSDPKNFPYKTADEVLAAYKAIQLKIEPKLDQLFSKKPKTLFEVRQTEAFRAATATAEYIPGSTDASRPGILYVPIRDASKTAIASEPLFLHEAIPGHHYQIMLQHENEQLPQFRRTTRSFESYAEGWGLYSEGLGKDLGLYTDVFQQMRKLQGELSRAVRLVVDPALHTKDWTREQAIKYLVEHGASERGATIEVERYMAIPGQAVSYKVGEMKLLSLRKKYENELGNAFNIAEFHDQILKDGAMPLDILEVKMESWAKKKKK